MEPVPADALVKPPDDGGVAIPLARFAEQVPGRDASVGRDEHRTGRGLPGRATARWTREPGVDPAGAVGGEA